MNCHETQNLLEAFVREELETARAREVVAHVKECPACRATHDELFAVRVTLREFAEQTAVAPTANFNRQVMAKIAAATPKPEAARKQNPQAPLPRAGAPWAGGVLPRLWQPLAVACVALLIAVCPPLREAWREQSSPSVLAQVLSFDVPANGLKPDPDLDAAIARHPENLRWKALRIFGFPNGQSLPTVKQCKGVDALLSKNPNDLWMLSLRVRMGYLNGSWCMEKPLGTKDQKLVRDNANAMIPLAKRGAELEPSNAFWKQMVTYFSFDLSDENAALSAAMKVSRARQINDYSQEYRRHQFAVRQLGGSLTPDEKLRLWAATNWFAGVGRSVGWELMRAAEKSAGAGNYKRELDFYDAALQDTLLMQDFEVRFSHYRLLKILRRWSRGGAPRNPVISPALLKSFCDYAIQHGRPDVAAHARHAVAVDAPRFAAHQKVIAAGWPPGVRTSDSSTLALQEAVQPTLCELWKNGALLWLSLGAALLLVPQIFRRVRRFVPTFSALSRIALPSPGRRAFLGALLLCLLASLGALMLDVGLAVQDWIHDYGTKPSLIQVQSFLSFYDFSHEKIDLRADVLRHLLPLSVVFWAALASWNMAIRAQEIAAGRQKTSLRQTMREGHFADLFPFVITWTLNLSTFVSWAALLVWWDTDTFSYVHRFALICAFLCAVRALVRWVRLPNRRAALGLMLLTLHRVVGASLVTGALLWVALQLAVLPARNRVDVAIDNLLRDGEHATMMRLASEK